MRRAGVVVEPRTLSRRSAGSSDVSARCGLSQLSRRVVHEGTSVVTRTAASLTTSSVSYSLRRQITVYGRVWATAIGLPVKFGI